MRRPRRAFVLAGSVGIAALSLVAVFATQVAHPGATAPNRLLGENAPPISGKNLLGGGPVRLSALRGRYVLVTFFASWCTPCNAEAPELESFQFDHRDDGAVIGVVFNDTAANAASFSRGVGATWPAVADPTSAIAVSYGVVDPPESFLVSPTGRVVAWFPGAVTLDSLNAELDKAEALDG